MRISSLHLLSLVTSALAANLPRGYHEPEDEPYHRGGGKSRPEGIDYNDCRACVTETTRVTVTYTTLCSVFETITEPGHTYVTTYTTTSTVKTVVPTTIVVTKTEPPVTKTTEHGKRTSQHRNRRQISLTCLAVIYKTITEPCPITETTVIDGQTIEITWTSTSTIITRVPEVQTVYETSVVTETETTGVYETASSLSLSLLSLSLSFLTHP